MDEHAASVRLGNIARVQTTLPALASRALGRSAGRGDSGYDIACGRELPKRNRRLYGRPPLQILVAEPDQLRSNPAVTAPYLRLFHNGSWPERQEAKGERTVPFPPQAGPPGRGEAAAPCPELVLGGSAGRCGSDDVAPGEDGREVRLPCL
jgi:hypothetical protein